MLLRTLIISTGLVLGTGMVWSVLAEQPSSVQQAPVQDKGRQNHATPPVSELDNISTGNHQTAPRQEEAPRLVVVLNALDKTTARVTQIEAVQNQPVRFGTLEITMRTCHSNPPEETPETAAFLEIRDILNNQAPKPVFTGWMFASSPSVSAMEHPVYDIWVASCKTLDGEAPASSE